MKIVFKRGFLERDSFNVIEYNGMQFGYAFDIASRDIRGTYLSCIEDFSVKFDGKEVSPHDMTIRLNGREFSVSQIPSLGCEIFGIADTAQIKVRDVDSLIFQHLSEISK